MINRMIRLVFFTPERDRGFDLKFPISHLSNHTVVLLDRNAELSREIKHRCNDNHEYLTVDCVVTETYDNRVMVDPIQIIEKRFSDDLKVFVLALLMVSLMICTLKF